MSDSTQGRDLAVGAELIGGLKYNEQGLIPAIVQDVENGQVLMMAWMNEASLRETVRQGLTCFWSRSRQQYWVKGKTSGHVQRVKSIRVDCDEDVLLIEVEQISAACHEGFRRCFYREIVGADPDEVRYEVTDERIAEPN
jgi:phosphoribosyl-AMP cyclohydrolase